MYHKDNIHCYLTDAPHPSNKKLLDQQCNYMHILLHHSVYKEMIQHNGIMMKDQNLFDIFH